MTKKKTKQRKMRPGCLPLEVFKEHPTERRHWDRPRTQRRVYISSLAWKHLWFLQEELEGVYGERDVCVSVDVYSKATTYSS